MCHFGPREVYLQVRNEDFAAAITDPIETASLFCAAPALRNTSAKLGNGSHGFAGEIEKPLVSQGNPTKQGVSKSDLAPRLGFEPRT